MSQALKHSKFNCISILGDFYAFRSARRKGRKSKRKNGERKKGEKGNDKGK